MKKIISIILFSIICILIYITSIKKETIYEKEELIIDLVTVTSSGATFKLTSTKEVYYTLFKDSKLQDGKVTNNYLELSNLSDDTEYTIKFTNSDTEISNTFKTSKISTLRFGGDVMMTSFFADYISRYGVDYMWEDVSNLLKTADYSMINLETSVSDRGASNKPEGYGFRSNPGTLKGLTTAGIDFVNIANNHVFDYGIDAFKDTLYNLNENKISYAGAGLNKEEAFSVKYEKINDLKVAFIGATSVYGSLMWDSSGETPGIAALKPDNYELLKNNIASAKKNADYVIVNLHWGREYEDYPEAAQITLAHSLIDSGADIIIGHHSHVLQGIENYNNGIIFYSIGNFNFLISTDNTMQTALFEIKLDKEKIVSSAMYPVKINYCKANLLKEQDEWYEEIIKNINIRSSMFNTTISHDGKISIKN